MITRITKRAVFGRTVLHCVGGILSFERLRMLFVPPNILRAVARAFHESRVEKPTLSKVEGFSTGLTCIATMFARTILVIFFLALYTNPAFSQTERGRILSTSEQQYVNLVKNGSLEAFSAGASLAPDGYVTAGLNTGTGSVASDATAKFQAYAVKLTQTNATGTYILRYDTAITGFGASLTGASADLTTTEWQRLTLYSTNGYTASAWVKLPGGASNPSAVTIKSDADQKVYIEIDSDANNDYCYIDGIQVTEGPLAPAYANAAISDVTDQQIFGDLRIQDNDSTNYIVLDKDTGNITMSGTLTATATNADTLDTLDSTQFLRSDTADEMTGTLTFSGVATDITTGANEHLALMPNGTGNVGIGTTGPGAALDILTDNYIGLNISKKTGSAAYPYLTVNGLRISGTDSTNTIYNFGSNIGITADSGAIISLSATSTPSKGLTVQTSSGSVGIGTTSPSALLALKGALASALTGTVSVTAASSAVTGVGTAFTTELAVGDAIKIGSETFTVSSIGSNTSLTLSANHTAGASGATAYKDANLFLAQNGAGTSKLILDKSGNLGIGATSPSKKLDVLGDINFTGSLYQNSSPYVSSQWTTSGSDVYYNTGNVGIGTTTPTTKLYVTDTASAASILANDTGGGNLLQLQVNGADKFVVNSEGLISTGAGGGWIESFTATANQIAFTLTAGTYTTGNNEILVFRDGFLQEVGSNADYVETNSTTITFSKPMYAEETVLVQRKGTIAAGSSGDITGVTAGAGLTGGGANGSVTLAVDVGTAANKIVQLDANAKLPAVDGSQLTNLSGTDSSKLAKSGDTMTGTLTLSPASGNALVTTAGNVGIGTTGPGYKLEVAGGSVKFGGSYLYLGDSGGTGVLERSIASGNLYFGETTDTGKFIFRGSGAMTIEGNVGIGTTGPGQKLDVNGAIALSGGISQTGTSTQLDIDPYQRVRIGRSTNNASFQLEVSRGDNTATANHVLKGVGDSYLAGNNGNLGIGTTSPTATLQVAGTFTTQAALLNSGNELVSNGGFDSDTTGWSGVGTATLASVAGGVSGNTLQVTSTIATTGIARHSFSVIVGKVYKFSAYIKKGTSADGIFRVGSSANASDYYYNDLTSPPTSWTQYSGTFKATTSTTYVDLISWGNSLTMLFDNVSVTEVPLNVNGDGYIANNLGIGTTSPSDTNSRLAVTGINGNIAADKALVYLNNTDDAASLIIKNAGTSAQTDRGPFEVKVGSTSVMRILNSGSVGIGTTGPVAKLTVTGAGTYPGYIYNNQITIQDTSPSAVGVGGGINFVGNYDGGSGDVMLDIGAGIKGFKHGGLSFPDYNWDLAFWTRNRQTGSIGERMRIQYDGNVGIGLVNPGAKLDISSPGGTTPTLRAYGNDADSYFQVGNDANNSVNLLLTRSDTVTEFSVTGHTGAGYLGAAAWSYGSDIRLKENVASISASGLNKIIQLKPVSFDYINGLKNNLGFIAQDVQTVIPEAVSIADPKTGYLGLKTDFIIPYLVKGMQEQQAQIENISGLGTGNGVAIAGNVGIGTTSPAGKLDVNGTIYQRGGLLHADYVFEPGYKLESIEAHSAFMWENKHLEAVPKAIKDESGQDMVEWGQRNKGILEELEKAHVYIEQLNGRIKVLEEKIKELEVRK